jgi:hypothetical protein
MVALGCVVAVTTVALLSLTPKKEPVKVWFVRSTNELGTNKLVFQGTNGISGEIEYFACVITNSIRHTDPRLRDPETLNEVRPFYSELTRRAASGETFYFNLEVPPKGTSYYLMWASDDRGQTATPWRRFRMVCYDFFRGHGMGRIAERFAPRIEMHYIPSTEFKE